jgi:phosphoribosylaminoimidazole carboxylase (NCAIR synthetase)
MGGSSVSSIAGINRFSRLAPSGDPPQPPEPDSITKSVIDAAKADRIKAIAECKATADADAAEVEKAKAKVAVEAESCKGLSKEAMKMELAADKAQKKLVLIRANIKRLKENPVKGEVSE